MLVCMRTSMNLPDALLEQAREHANATGRTVTSLVEEALRKLLAEHNVPTSPPRRALTTSGVKAAVDAAGRRAAVAGVSAHRLRHTAATEMLRCGAGLAEIGQVLRHNDISTTALYAKVDHAALRTLALPWPAGAS